jgi:hypothetical protein
MKIDFQRLWVGENRARSGSKLKLYPPATGYGIRDNCSAEKDGSSDNLGEMLDHFPDRDPSCQWAALPKGLPPRSTVNIYLCRWDDDRTLGRIHYALHVLCREKAGRKGSPTAAVIHS